MSAILRQFDIVRVTAVCHLPPQVSLTSWNYLIGPVAGSPTDLQFVQEYNTAMAAFFKACITSGANFRGFMAQLLRPIPSPAAATDFDVFARVSDISSFGSGGRAATPMPGQVRGLVRYSGALASRGLNNRSYMPFPATTDDLGDGMTPTTSYHTAILAVGVEAVNFSSINDGAGNTALCSLVDFTPSRLPNYVRQNLTNTVAQPRWATQRRSGAYGRPNVPPI